MTSYSEGKRLGPIGDILAALILSTFVGSILAANALVLTAIWWLVQAPWSPVGWTLLAITIAVTLMPLRDKNGRFGEAYMTCCCNVAKDYFPVTVITEEEAAFSRDKTYVVGLEPHSALPTAIPTVFGLQSDMLPEALRGRTHGLASSVCFQVPLARHVYWWNGIRPITRQWFRKLLQHGRCVVLVPGGVQECLYMQKGSETAFLRNRKGFIRIAMQNGSAVVPCFAFGQSAVYHWFRPGPPFVSDAFVQAMSRRIGFVPLGLVGRLGTTAPINSPMTVVLGKPIEMPQMDQPSEELLQKYLDQYISSMQEIFEKHKAAAGYAHYKLNVL
eukprot:GHUV01005520.1.p1 GENE.GHUV01005520.1~~GHUV01005520.1.p1  ORF type:complete len:330 (+),score=53.00 GHUV01005520.1:324-1313(+)